MFNLYISYVVPCFLFATDRKKSVAHATIVFTFPSLVFAVFAFSDCPEVHSFLTICKDQLSIT